MYISFKWLQKYLPEIEKYSASDIAEALTVSIAEVEEFIHVRKDLKNIVVGEVIETEKHPQSNKLTICQVSIDTSNDLHTIVCGAPNVAEKQKVAVCLPGGAVLNPKSESQDEYYDISETKILDVLSKGMICSSKELGLSNEHTEILILENELPKGTNLIPILQDTIFEIENKSISHRGDCFSHIGIARELAAIFKIDITDQPLQDNPIISAANPINYSVNIKVDEKLCKRFTSIALSEVKVKNSPIWLQSLLSAVGTRPINNVVDITNYTMLDKGQPLHAYDFDKLKGGKLIVRHAKQNETVNTLDQKSYSLTNQMVIVADEDGVEDIAGIMGGAETEITNETTNVILEAATWEMYNIRRTSRTLGLRSEAGTRFEKGIDANITLPSLISAVSLLTDITEVEVASEVQDDYRNKDTEHFVDFDITLVSRFLGLDLSKQQIIDLLKSLHFEIIENTTTDKINTNVVAQNQLTLKIPTYRQDIHIKQDIAEEIARIYGYPNIKPSLPIKDLTPTKHNLTIQIQRIIQDTLVNAGFDELMTYSFVGEKIYSVCNLDIHDCLEIINPLSPELSHMRNTLLPSVIDKMKSNISDFDKFSFFEIGRAIQTSLNKEGIHNQPKKISGLLIDTTLQNNKSYYNLKGKLDSLFKVLNLNVKYSKISKSKIKDTLFHPNKSATISIDEVKIGDIGILHPKIASNLELNNEITIFELDFDLIKSYYSNDKKYTALSQYQSVHRDLSFLLKDEINYAQITDSINALNDPLINDVTLLDIYKKSKDNNQDANQKDNEKSVTISITLQSTSKTLEEKDITTVIEKLINKLKKDLKAVLRT